MRVSEMTDEQQREHFSRLAGLMGAMAPKGYKFAAFFIPPAGEPEQVHVTDATPAEILAWLRSMVEAREAGKKPVTMTQFSPGRPPVDLRGKCPGKGGDGDPCCDNAGLYNGFASDGPLSFVCPKGCSCHD